MSEARSFSPSAKTALCGVVLHPAGHTRSPAMHNAAFRALGLDAVYLAFDVPPAQLPQAGDGARALRPRLLAASLSHHVAHTEHPDQVNPTARPLGTPLTRPPPRGG